MLKESNRSTKLGILNSVIDQTNYFPKYPVLSKFIAAGICLTKLPSMSV